MEKNKERWKINNRDIGNLPVDAPLGTAALARVPSDNVTSTCNNPHPISGSNFKVTVIF